MLNNKIRTRRYNSGLLDQVDSTLKFDFVIVRRNEITVEYSKSVIVL